MKRYALRIVASLRRMVRRFCKNLIVIQVTSTATSPVQATAHGLGAPEEKLASDAHASEPCLCCGRYRRMPSLLCCAVCYVGLPGRLMDKIAATPADDDLRAMQPEVRAWQEAAPWN